MRSPARCQVCLSERLILCPAGERPRRFLEIRAFRKCQNCGFVFEPPIRLAYAIAVTCLGAALCVIFVREAVDLTGTSDTFLDTILAMFSVYLTVVGARYVLRKVGGRVR
jgi:hypothetical protein